MFQSPVYCRLGTAAKGLGLICLSPHALIISTLAVMLGTALLLLCLSAAVFSRERQVLGPEALRDGFWDIARVVGEIWRTAAAACGL